MPRPIHVVHQVLKQRLLLPLPYHRRLVDYEYRIAMRIVGHASHCRHIAKPFVNLAVNGHRTLPGKPAQHFRRTPRWRKQHRGPAHSPQGFDQRRHYRRLPRPGIPVEQEHRIVRHRRIATKTGEGVDQRPLLSRRWKFHRGYYPFR